MQPRIAILSSRWYLPPINFLVKSYQRFIPFPSRSRVGFHVTLASSSSRFGMSAMENTAESLPPLSAAEFKRYNHLAEMMEYYHNHFRASWTTLHDACKANKRPGGMSIRQFVHLGIDFCNKLNMHHGIEESHIFPILSKRMPAFERQKAGKPGKDITDCAELLNQHDLIHPGLEKMEAYLQGCLYGERELRMQELREIMDSFGDVLWKHMKEEVDELRAENMRKYWKIEEMDRLRF